MEWKEGRNMKKWIVTMLILLMWPATVMAHSHMETSVPENGATVIEPLEEVVLTFSAGIEEGSTLTLTGVEGKVEFTEFEIEDRKVRGTLAEPLPDGQWTLGWNVISEDGHPIEGEINFESAAGISAEEEVNEGSAEEEGTGTDSPGGEEPMTEKDRGDQDNAQDQQEEGNNTLLTVGLIIVVLILLALIFMAVRKKK